MRKIHHVLLAIYLTSISSFIYAADFDQTLELQGISFKVHATDKGSINQRAVLKQRDALVTALHNDTLAHTIKPQA